MPLKRNKKIQMYVLSAKDIQRLEDLSYQKALKKLKSFEYFYINSKPYILARDYFCEQYELSEIITYEPITEGIETKLIKVIPTMLTVQDIQTIFSCGQRQSYQIMDAIPGTFKINSKRYISDRDFVLWLETLPNKCIKIA